MQFHDKFWNKQMLCLTEMERRGITIDSDYLERKRELALEEVRTLEAKLNGWAYDYMRQTDCPVNWNSPVQVSSFLYDYKCFPIPPVKGGLNAAKRNHKREPTTSQAALDWLAKNTSSATERDNLKALIQANKTGTLAQFMAKLPTLVSPDGRLRCSIGPGTDTGRLNCSKPNLQNIPVRDDKFGIRSAFTAAEGKLLVVADYSQLEMYVIAHFLLYFLNDDSVYRDLCSGDVHTSTAFRIWGDQLRELGATHDNIKEVAKRFRSNAKTVNYAIPYGKTASGLGMQITNQEGLAIGKAAAQQILDGYFAAYPGLDRLFGMWRDEARRNGCVRTVLGRTRPLPRASSDDQWERWAAERQAVNTPIQGSAADIVTTAMLRCVGLLPTPKQKALAATGAELLLQVHDELIFEVPEDRAEEACTLVKEIMENPFDAPLRVQLKVDAEVGRTWGDCK